LYKLQINHEKFGDIIIFDDVSKKNHKMEIFRKNTWFAITFEVKGIFKVLEFRVVLQLKFNDIIFIWDILRKCKNKSI